jgi:Rad3-related DNA helicase
VFLIADSRAARREYGQVFLDGLPDTELRFMRQDDVAAAVRDWLSR